MTSTGTLVAGQSQRPTVSAPQFSLWKEEPGVLAKVGPVSLHSFDEGGARRLNCSEHVLQRCLVLCPAGDVREGTLPGVDAEVRAANVGDSFFDAPSHPLRSEPAQPAPEQSAAVSFKCRGRQRRNGLPARSTHVEHTSSPEPSYLPLFFAFVVRDRPGEWHHDLDAALAAWDVAPKFEPPLEDGVR